MVWKNTIKFFLIVTLTGLVLILLYVFMPAIIGFDGKCYEGGIDRPVSEYSCGIWQKLKDGSFWAIVALYFFGFYWLLASIIATVFFWFWQKNKKDAKDNPTTHHFQLFTLVGIISGFLLILISMMYGFPKHNSLASMILFDGLLVVTTTAIGAYYDRIRNKLSAKSKTPTI